MITFENCIIAFGFFTLCYGLNVISNIFVSGAVFVAGIIIVIWQNRKSEPKQSDDLVQKYKNKL